MPSIEGIRKSTNSYFSSLSTLYFVTGDLKFFVQIGNILSILKNFRRKLIKSIVILVDFIDNRIK